VRRRIDLDLDPPVALGLIDRARFCSTDTETNHRAGSGRHAWCGQPLSWSLRGCLYSRANFRLRVRHRSLGRGIDVYWTRQHGRPSSQGCSG